MAAVVNTGMSKAEMKKLLLRSKEEPVHCAVGIGDNAAFGLLMLHKLKQGRMVEAMLKEECPDAKNTRFGTAFVDIEDDPKLVKFTLNRAVSGIAKRLVKTLKKTGFTKVQILTEDGSAMESFEEEDEEAESTPAAPGTRTAAEVSATPVIHEAPPAAGLTAEERAAKIAAMNQQLAALAATIPGNAGNDTGRKAMLLKLATSVNVYLKTGNLNYAANALLQLKKALDGAAGSPVDGSAAKPATGAGTTAEASATPVIHEAPPAAGLTAEERAAKIAAMNQQLAALAATIPGNAGNDTERKAMLLKLATSVNVYLKTGNLNYAANALLQLKKALDGAAGNPVDGSAAKPATGNMELAKSRLAWVGARQQVELDIDKLRSALASAYGGQDVGGEVMQRFQATVAPVLARFDDRLLDAIDGLMNEADAAARGTKLTAAKGVVKDCLSFAMTDKMVADLDANPFVPLAIRSTSAAALAVLAKAMQ